MLIIKFRTQKTPNVHLKPFLTIIRLFRPEYFPGKLASKKILAHLQYILKLIPNILECRMYQTARGNRRTTSWSFETRPLTRYQPPLIFWIWRAKNCARNESSTSVVFTKYQQNVEGKKGDRRGQRNPKSGDRFGRQGHYELRRNARLA